MIPNTSVPAVSASESVRETKLTASDLLDAIAARYEAPEWHLESEVTLGSRRLDVVALNMWKARDYRIVGFEIKVSRGDWLRELSAFQKSEEWMAVVDAFYVVTPPKLVKDDELPIGWGLLELCGSRMMTRRHAEVRQGSTMLPREVAARFISRISQAGTRADREAHWRASHELRSEIEQQVRASLAESQKRDKDELSRLRREHTEILNALGLTGSEWDVHKAALKAAGVFARAAGDTTALRAQLDRNIKAFESHVARMRDAHTALSEGLS